MKLVRICKDSNHNILGLVPQGQTKLYAIFIKAFYYICGIKFQNNGVNVKYAVKTLSSTRMSIPKEPVLGAGKTKLAVVQK